MRRRALVWNEEKALEPVSREPILCTNPLTWRLDEDSASADNHVGAASATGLKLGETPPKISGAVGARCEAGVLFVDQPRQTFLRRNRWFAQKWKTRHYNLFYHDLAEDVERRITVLEKSQRGSN